MTKQDTEQNTLAVTYLGDGLYAENDGFMLRLYTQTGDNIYLEPEVYQKLVDWMNRK